MDRHLSEVEGLFRKVQSRAGRSLPVRARASAHSKAAPSQDAQLIEEDEDKATTQLSARESVDVDDQLAEPVQVYQATATVIRYNEQILHTWHVKNIVEVFPKDIWPNLDTGWKVDVLKKFLTIAEKYPDQRSREKITAKFAELCRIRQSKPRAKSQWTLADMTATEEWAKEHCRPSTVSNQVSQEQGTVIDVSSSQRLRKSGLVQGVNKGKQKASQVTEATVQKKTRRSVYEISSQSEPE
jgi:hypothetical protein